MKKIGKYAYLIIFIVLISIFGGICFACKVSFTPENLSNIGLWISLFIGTYLISYTIQCFCNKFIKKNVSNFIVYLVTFLLTTIFSGMFTFSNIDTGNSNLWLVIIGGAVSSFFAVIAGLLEGKQKRDRAENQQKKSIYNMSWQELNGKAPLENQEQLLVYLKNMVSEESIFLCFSS